MHPPQDSQSFNYLDLIATYVEAKEVLGESISIENLIDLLAPISLEASLTFTSVWTSRLRSPQQDVSSGVDEQFINAFFDAKISQKARSILASGRRRLVTLQTLSVLTKLAFFVCGIHNRPPTGEEEPILAVVLIGLAEHLAADVGLEDDETNSRHVITGNPGPLGRELIANHLFNSTSSEAGRMAMFQRCWRELPIELASDSRMIDLPAAFDDAVGVSLPSFQAVVAVLWASSFRNPIVELTHLNSIGLSEDVIRRVLDLVARPPEDFREMIFADVARYGLNWSMRSLQQYPVVEWRSGQLLILDSSLMLDRAIGDWPLFDMVRELEPRGQGRQINRIRQAVAFTREAYALEGVDSAIGSKVGRPYTEADLKRAYRRGKVCDRAVDYGHSWILFEVTMTTLQAGTIAGTDDSSVVADIEDYLKKIDQLSTTIDNLISAEGALTRKPGLLSGRRYYPVLVVANRIATNPIFLTLLREKVAERGLLRQRGVHEIEVLDIEDVDVALSLMSSRAYSLLDLLIEKTASGASRVALKDYILMNVDRDLRRPTRVEERWKTWTDDAVDLLTPKDDTPGV